MLKDRGSTGTSGDEEAVTFPALSCARRGGFKMPATGTGTWRRDHEGPGIALLLYSLGAGVGAGTLRASGCAGLLYPHG